MASDNIEVSVHVVDDELDAREAISRVLFEMGFRVETYTSAENFISRYCPGEPGCVILDFAMPGLSGVELQSEMISRGWLIPVLIVSGHADVPLAVKSMESGAVAVLEKPFDSLELESRVVQALKLDSVRRAKYERDSEFRQKYESLTRKEREVMHLVVSGLLSKHVAQELGSSERTIAIHRSRIMRKMQVKTVAALTALCVKNGILDESSIEE